VNNRFGLIVVAASRARQQYAQAAEVAAKHGQLPTRPLRPRVVTALEELIEGMVDLEDDRERLIRSMQARSPAADKPDAAPIAEADALAAMRESAAITRAQAHEASV
jgi:DNA-directed RNA polymerase subunit K/omega